MKDIVIFGTGKITNVIVSLLQSDAGLKIKAFTCDREYISSNESHGLPLVPFDEVENAFPPTNHQMLVAIGYHELNAVRQQRCDMAREKGYRLLSWISPKAHVPDSCEVGENCVVMPGASLQPHSRLGDGVFIWDNAVIGHHSTVRAYCWIAANSSVSSTADVGERCFVGVNAAIGHNLTIGVDCLIGAGAVVTRSAEPGGVYVTQDTERYRLDSRRFMRIAQMF